MVKSVAIKNEQRLNNVKRQEVNSLVQAPRSDNGASTRECRQKLETLHNEI